MNRADRVRKTWEGKEGREFERVAFREGKKERVTLWEGREDSEGVTFREGKEGRGFERVAFKEGKEERGFERVTFRGFGRATPSTVCASLARPVWPYPKFAATTCGIIAIHFRSRRATCS